MKVLYCPDCHDLVILVDVLRTCRCKKVQGRYINDTYAETNGEGIAMAFGTGDFNTAVMAILQAPQTHNRKWYQDNCRLKWVWMRPSTGPGNPHTRVEK